MSRSYRILAARLREGIEELELVIQQAQKHWAIARTSNDEAYWNSVALNLHGFYVGVERLCEDVAQTVDQSVPTGRNWHMDAKCPQN
ncbi:MAG: hypothetical protein RMK99_02770 [Anaerolineales bacterium]|nr:hypothetical protein [Anaerolineales bacterium]